MGKTNNGRGRGRPPISPPTSTTTVFKGRLESVPEAFNRIASYRVNAIITKLNTLAKMASGKGRYEYKDEDVEFIRRTLIQSVNVTCDRLRRKPSPEGFSFERRSDNATA